MGVGRLDHSKTKLSSYSEFMHKQPRHMSRACVTLPEAGDLRFWRPCARRKDHRGGEMASKNESE